MGSNKLQCFAQEVPGKVGVVTSKELEGRCSPDSVWLQHVKANGNFPRGTREVREGPVVTENFPWPFDFKIKGLLSE